MTADLEVPVSWRASRDEMILIVIDVQEKLAAHIHEAMVVQQNIDRLVRGCHLLGVPALITEQYPRGIGPTTELVRNAFEETFGFHPIQKMCFSAAGVEAFDQLVAESGRRRVLMTGIETHVCVWQTSMDLLVSGFEVTLVADAVSSRTERNRQTALRRLESEGALISSTEMVLFELCIESGTDEFRAISRLVK